MKQFSSLKGSFLATFLSASAALSSPSKARMPDGNQLHRQWLGDQLKVPPQSGDDHRTWVETHSLAHQSSVPISCLAEMNWLERKVVWFQGGHSKILAAEQCVSSSAISTFTAFDESATSSGTGSILMAWPSGSSFPSQQS